MQENSNSSEHHIYFGWILKLRRHSMSIKPGTCIDSYVYARARFSQQSPGRASPIEHDWTNQGCPFLRRAKEGRSPPELLAPNALLCLCQMLRMLLLYQYIHMYIYIYICIPSHQLTWKCTDPVERLLSSWKGPFGRVCVCIYIYTYMYLCVCVGQGLNRSAPAIQRANTFRPSATGQNLP